jgi:sensor histidine kinase YesM
MRKPIKNILFYCSRAFCCVALFVSWGNAAPLESPCEILPTAKKQNITPFIEVFSDTSCAITPAQINKDEHTKAFIRKGAGALYVPQSGAAVWLRYAIRNPFSTPTEKWIVVDWRMLYTLETFVETNGALFPIDTTGMRFPFFKRPLKFRNYCVPVHIAPNSDLIVYHRIRSPEAMTLPFYLWEPGAFRENDQKTFFFFGAFYGLTIAVLLITLVIYLLSKDRVYLYCSLMIIFLHVFFTMSRQGLSQMFLFSHWPDLTAPAHLAFVSIGQVFGLLLAQSFLRYQFKTRWGPLVYYGQLAVLVFAAVFPFFAGYAAGTKLVTNFSLMSMASVLLINISAVTRGNRPALYFLFAWVSHILGGITIIATQKGLLSNPFIADYGYEIGLCLELLLITAAAAYSYSIEQKKKAVAQHELFSTQKTSLDALENRMKSQMRELQAKITPHFLFNALNSIAALASQNAGEVERAIAMLSTFYRQTQSFSQRKTVMLSEEMDLVNTYVSLQKIRFGNRLEYRGDLAANLFDFPLPALIIQPLVENAIKHGISPKTEGGVITVSAETIDNEVCITVRDNGVGWSDKLSTSGHGLENIMDRLKLTYGNNHGFNISSDQGVTIRITLPHGRNNGVSHDDH